MRCAIERGEVISGVPSVKRQESWLFESRFFGPAWVRGKLLDVDGKQQCTAKEEKRAHASESSVFAPSVLRLRLEVVVEDLPSAHHLDPVLRLEMPLDVVHPLEPVLARPLVVLVAILLERRRGGTRGLAEVLER